jgi:hypothetical protein
MISHVRLISGLRLIKTINSVSNYTVYLALAVVCLFHEQSVAQTDSLRYVFQPSPSSVTSQVSLTGLVTDLNKQPIPRVSIYVDGQFTGTNTDDQGKYFLSLKPGDYRVVFRHVSMLPVIVSVSLGKNGVVNVVMYEKKFNLEEVVVEAEGAEQNVSKIDAGVIRMGIKELKQIPSFMGEPDVIKGLQFMPGITSVGEGSAGINVRGGQADQNLIMINEVMVLNSNHALGFLSPFNPDVVQDFTLFKGNLPSYYGGRSSAALNIQMKEGNPDQWKFQGTLGTTASKLFAEGPVIKNRLTFLSGLRISNTNWVLNQVRNKDIQNSSLTFHDFYGSLQFSISPKSQLTLNTLSTGDYFKFSEEFGYDWKSSVTSLQFKSLPTNRLALQALIAYGRFRNNYFDPTGNEAATLRNGMDYWQSKISALFTIEKHTLTAGFESIYYLSKPESLSPYNEQSAVISESIEKDKGIELAGFIAEEWTPLPALGISAGLRFSLFQQLAPDSIFLYANGQTKSIDSITDTLSVTKGLIKQYQGLEPRIAIRFTITQDQSLKLSYNRLIQYIQSLSTTTAPTPIDLWQISSYYIKPQISDNISLGYFINLKENKWSFSIETFYRKTQNVLDYKNFPDLFMNNHLETELVNGRGKAYGLEFLVKRNRGKWTGWLAYTYSRSFIQVVSPYPEELINNGNWYPAVYDKPHVASWIMNRKLWPNGLLGFSFTYSTGRPISAVSSTYVVDGVSIPNYSNRNEYRIPDYYRVDISYTAGSVLKKLNDSLSITVYNLFSRRNAYSVFFQSVDNSLILKPYRLSILGTVFPSVTYSVTF